MPEMAFRITTWNGKWLSGPRGDIDVLTMQNS